ncbi:ATP-binding protein [Methylibium sp.]|uniref:ATP-binding protein n=1 Tax=Methylibium sp. TaxID=2067992 RepID=UPI003D12C730
MNLSIAQTVPEPADAHACNESAVPSTGDQVQELLRANAELKQLNARLSDAQDKLMQSEKLASIGQLAAGVAHEINNPIGYIFSNFGTLEKYIADLFEMLAAYEEAETALAGTPVGARLETLRETIELDFLKDDIPMLMSESKEGITRVRKIVQNLKDFSRVDTTQEWVMADLHHGIDSTLNIVNNEIKYKADVVKAYGEMPDVECLPSELNQVFMNLLVNAAHAITAERGTITVRTGCADDTAWVEVADSGEGIAKENLGRIFDPFFTTKPVGKGTGLGLSLSYGIVKKHLGQIEVSSEVGVGTVFRVTLPVRRRPEA